MDARESDANHPKSVIAHADEVIKQIQLDILEINKKIQAKQLAAKQGIPSCLLSLHC